MQLGGWGQRLSHHRHCRCHCHSSLLPIGPTHLPLQHPRQLPRHASQTRLSLPPRSHPRHDQTSHQLLKRIYPSLHVCYPINQLLQPAERHSDHQEGQSLIPSQSLIRIHPTPTRNYRPKPPQAPQHPAPSPATTTRLSPMNTRNTSLTTRI